MLRRRPEVLGLAIALAALCLGACKRNGAGAGGFTMSSK